MPRKAVPLLVKGVHDLVSATVVQQAVFVLAPPAPPRATPRRRAFIRLVRGAVDGVGGMARVPSRKTQIQREPASPLRSVGGPICSINRRKPATMLRLVERQQTKV